jgi:hypothetical protein
MSIMPNGLRQLSAAADALAAPAPSSQTTPPPVPVAHAALAGASPAAPLSGLVSQLLGQSSNSTYAELQDRSRELARSMSRPEEQGGNPAAQEELSTLLVLGSIAMASLMRANTSDSVSTGGAARADPAPSTAS